MGAFSQDPDIDVNYLQTLQIDFIHFNSSENGERADAVARLNVDPSDESKYSGRSVGQNDVVNKVGDSFCLSNALEGSKSTSYYRLCSLESSVLITSAVIGVLADSFLIPGLNLQSLHRKAS